MKMQVHITHKDEETGEFYRRFCGHVEIPEGMNYFEARELACAKLPRCYYNAFTSVHFAPVGVRVKLRGSLSEKHLNRLWAVVRETERAEGV